MFIDGNVLKIHTRTNKPHKGFVSVALTLILLPQSISAEFHQEKKPKLTLNSSPAPIHPWPDRRLKRRKTACGTQSVPIPTTSSTDLVPLFVSPSNGEQSLKEYSEISSRAKCSFPPPVPDLSLATLFGTPVPTACYWADHYTTQTW